MTNFVCSFRFDDGAIKHSNFQATDEIDACWRARDIAEANDASLVNVWAPRNARQNRR